MTNPEFLATLRREITENGWDRKATGRIIGELIIHLFLALGGIAAVIYSDNLFLQACGFIIFVTGSIAVGTNTHTSSHYGTSDRRWVNDWLTYFGYPFFLGLSASFWRHQHITIHHPSPNVVGVDQDADLSPWFAMTKTEAQSYRGLRRWYYENVQWLIFPLALMGNCANFVKSGWVHLISSLRDPAKRRREHWIDLGALILHHVAYLGAPLYFFALQDVLLFYLLRSLTLGYGMFAVLAPGHFPAEASRLSADQKDSDYVLMQTAGTVDFRTGRIGQMLSSGLGYQIEHHLFPNLSHVHYRKLSPLVEKLCREHGFPYRAYSWGGVIWKSLMVFRSPRAVVTDVDSLRVR